MFNHLVILFLIVISPNVAIAADPPVMQFLTRAEAVTLLLRQSRHTIPTLEANSRYADMLDRQWYTSPMMYAIRIGMIDADPEHGLLFPHRSVSRGEFLKMLTIAFALEEGLPYRYSDVPSNSWLAKYAGASYFYHVFKNPDAPELLKPNLRVTHRDALRGLQNVFRIEPRLEPIHKKTILGTEFQTAETAASPSMVKRSLQKLFQRRDDIHPDVTRFQVLGLVNEVRRQHGLHPLRHNDNLRRAADLHARDMHQRGYFSHNTPEGVDYVERIRASGYLEVDQEKCGCRSIFHFRSLVDQFKSQQSPDSITSDLQICGCQPSFSLGENIAKGQLTVQEVVRDWLNSPSHRANILHQDFEELGVGLFGNIWVQNFGRVRVE